MAGRIRSHDLSGQLATAGSQANMRDGKGGFPIVDDWRGDVFRIYRHR
jgi:hypothetical protein